MEQILTKKIIKKTEFWGGVIEIESRNAMSIISTYSHSR